MKTLLVTLILAAAAPAAFAQNAKENSSNFLVDFRIQDASGPPRHYSIPVESTGKSSFRLGRKIPYSTGPDRTNYADVGMNIDCRVREQNGVLHLIAGIEMSDVATPDKEHPIFGQTHVNVEYVVPEGKATKVAVVDDPVTQRKLTIEATVTRRD